MVKNKLLPVLGEDGWVEGKKKLDYLLAHFYASDAAQTHFFQGAVSSMARVTKDHQGRIIEARRAIEETLTSYLGKYFKSVDIRVSIEDNSDLHFGEITLAGLVEEETGEKFDIHEVMSDKNSLVRRFLKIQE